MSRVYVRIVNKRRENMITATIALLYFVLPTFAALSYWYSSEKVFTILSLVYLPFWIFKGIIWMVRGQYLADVGRNVALYILFSSIFGNFLIGVPLAGALLSWYGLLKRMLMPWTQ